MHRRKAKQTLKPSSYFQENYNISYNIGIGMMLELLAQHSKLKLLDSDYCIGQTE